MIVGFTGTRHGCTKLQVGFLELILREKLAPPGPCTTRGAVWVRTPRPWRSPGGCSAVP